MKAAVVFFTILLSSKNILSCEMSKSGAGLSYNSLIEASELIFLGKVGNKTKKLTHSTLYFFDVVEVIKGNLKNKSFAIDGYVNPEKHDGNNFNNHTDKIFWDKDIGRSEWPCCICGPAFTFVKGELYLIFYDSFGAMKAAEIIKNKDSDKWYKYVLEKIKPSKTK